jgi:Predicted membrane protein (DUF2254)
MHSIIARLVAALHQLWNHLRIPESQSMLEAYATIMATVITLLLTVSMIPLQQCASQYSPTLLKYFLHDRKLRQYVVVLLGTLGIILLFLLFPINRPIMVAATVLVGWSFIELVRAVLRIATMLDPVEYLLPEAKKGVTAALDRAFRDAVQAKESSAGEWKQAFDQGSKVGGDYPNIRDPKLFVPTELQEAFKREIMPLKTLALRLSAAADYETFAELLRNLGELSRQYLIKRQEYKSYNDSLVWFLSEMFDDLIKNAEQNPNVLFSSALFETVRDCAITAIDVKVLGRAKGYNELQHPFSLLLNSSARRSLERKDTSRDYDAELAFADVGVALANRGLAQSAEKVAADLYGFGVACLGQNRLTTAVLFFKKLQRIFFLCLWNGKVYPEFDNPYGAFSAAVDLVLGKSIEMDLESSVTDPIFGIGYDVADTPNLSWICFAALFSPATSPEVLQTNLLAVQRVLATIRKRHIGSGKLEWALTLHLYQLGLWLLAAIDRDVFAGIAYSDASSKILDTPPESLRTLLVGTVEHSVRSYGGALKKPSIAEVLEKRELERTYINYEDHLLRVVLSLLYLLFHFDKLHGRGLAPSLKSCVTELIAAVSQSTDAIPQDQCESLLLFSAYLAGTSDAEIADALKTAVASKRSTDAYKKEDVLAALERPPFGFRNDAVQAWTNAIFGTVESVPKGV